MLENPTPLRSVYLKPGELLITTEPCEVTTVLGSCVSVTLYHPRLQYAAICHGMLPGPFPSLSLVTQGAERYKYLSEAIPLMADKFRRAGVAMNEIEVKLFGGGNVIGQSNRENSDRWIGSVNIQAAQELLKTESLTIKTGCVGGDKGRKIIFNTNNGEVLHRYL